MAVDVRGDGDGSAPEGVGDVFESNAGLGAGRPRRGAGGGGAGVRFRRRRRWAAGLGGRWRGQAGFLFPCWIPAGRGWSRSLPRRACLGPGLASGFRALRRRIRRARFGTSRIVHAEYPRAAMAW